MKLKIQNRNLKLSLVTIMIILSTIFYAYTIAAEPVGPTITVLGNTSKAAAAATKVNGTNGTKSPGGFIFTLSLDSRQQNNRWKGYVGNVTGTFALDDSNDYTMFEWSLTSIAGEVYATRASGTVNWTSINCTWIADSKLNASDGLQSNRSPEHNENLFLNHRNKDDNVSATFDKANHSAIEVGSIVIGKNECFSVQTWQKDNAQSFQDSDNANFTQVILYDGSLGEHNGNVVYATIIESDNTAYDSTETYDFQMLLPEDSSLGFSSSTAYYFYVELS